VCVESRRSVRPSAVPLAPPPPPPCAICILKTPGLDDFSPVSFLVSPQCLLRTSPRRPSQTQRLRKLVRFSSFSLYYLRLLTAAGFFDALPPSSVLFCIVESASFDEKEKNLNLKLDKHGLPLIPQPSDDPSDPLNWPQWLKIAILLQASTMALLGPFNQAVINPGKLPLSSRCH
jgi:hypothetical protein